MINIAAEKKPVYLILYVTARCNYRCSMCFYWNKIENSGDVNELKLDEIEKISKGFGSMLQLSLTGGEPFLRTDLPEICKIFARNNKVRYITIPTNASLPLRIRDSVERMLKENPNVFFRIPLSIDGLYQEHDRIRNHQGAFESVLETYKELSLLRKNYKNLVVDVNIAYTSYNEKTIDGIIDFVDKNMKVDNLSVTLARGDTKKPEAKSLSIDNYLRVIKKLSSRPKRRESRAFSALIRGLVELTWDTVYRTVKENREIVPCLAGKRLVVVDEEGKVYPCEIMGLEMGSLRESNFDINEIMHSDKAKAILKKIKDTRCFCSFECAIIISLAFNIINYPKLLSKTLMNLIRGAR